MHSLDPHTTLGAVPCPRRNCSSEPQSALLNTARREQQTQHLNPDLPTLNLILFHHLLLSPREESRNMLGSYGNSGGSRPPIHHSINCFYTGGLALRWGGTVHSGAGRAGPELHAEQRRLQTGLGTAASAHSLRAGYPGLTMSCGPPDPSRLRPPAMCGL